MTNSIQAPKALLQAQALAHLADNKVRIPVIGIRVGLDFIIGLIPVLGDIIMACVSFVIVALAIRLGVPKPLIFAMVKNIVIDFLLGLIPIVGDIIDVFYKSNEKNVRLIEQWWVSKNSTAIHQYSQNKLAEWEQKL